MTSRDLAHACAQQTGLRRLLELLVGDIFINHLCKMELYGFHLDGIMG
jgi:hypothetical protein